MINYPKHICNLLAQKKRLFNSLVNPLSNLYYKKVCADLNFHIIRFHSNYEKRLAKTTGMKDFFSHVRSKVKNTAPLPVIENLDQKLCFRDKEKADALGQYFASVFTSSYSSEYMTTEADSSDSSAFPYIIVTPKDVFYYLRKLKPSASSSIDGIPQIFYKHCAETLSKPLSIMFNISLLFGEIPQAWKDAIVTAIPKKTNARKVTDFRPISICPTPVKILEKIIRDKMLSWLAKMKVIPSEQHGFCLGASTTTQLVDSTFDWTTALSNKNSVDIIYLDLSKAFDKVSHIKLLSKIANLGISTQVLMWLKDYLSKRHMYVKVGYDYSDRFSCHSGVPQGGVLSPLLFIVYCYDLPDGLKTHPNVKIQIYADDIKIYGNYNEQSKDEVHSAVSESLRRMVDWANNHEIPINLNKSTVFHIGKSFSGEYSVNGTILIKSNLVKDLGVLFDSRMQFTNHIDHITKKALSTMFTILRNVHTNDQHVLLRLYKSTSHPNPPVTNYNNGSLLAAN
ncbi:hypothetical protein Y032_0044g1073 [Ancylostoma ceylanicum]|nr:hypothetical protein Y032_0044g1073 [Ancylostoma ceylanicum]